MFAHQVIADMDNFIKFRKNNEISTFQKRLLNLNDEIKKAHKFHMGNADALVDTIRIDEGQTLFEKNKQYLKLPYKNMWFDFVLDKKEKKTVSPDLGGECFSNTKEAVLVTRITETVWAAMTYTFCQERGMWAPGFFPCVICVGTAGDEENKKTLDALFPEGNLVSDESNIFPAANLPDGIDDKHTKPILHEMAINFGFLERSITLLNCKNIETQKIAAPKALNKKRKESGKLPVFDYYVLNLVLPSNKKRGYQQQSTPLSHNRVHLCRGHFKEYTNEHPLFGRLTGLYWWEPHVRGQNKKGIVMKDYKVTPKKGEI